jgi:hypothetical protein
MSISTAKLVLCLGRKNVWPVIHRLFELESGEALVGPMDLAGSPRYIAFLEHPGAGSLRLSKLVSPEKLQELRAFISA